MVMSVCSYFFKTSYFLFSNIYFDVYLVTTKEYETCEDKDANEEPSVPKENAEEVPKTEIKPTVKHPSPPGKTKQKSITSFFTRK